MVGATTGVGFVDAASLEAAKSWTLKDFVNEVKSRLAREVNIARSVAQKHGDDYFDAYADGMADAIAILEDVYRELRGAGA